MECLVSVKIKSEISLDSILYVKPSYQVTDSSRCSYSRGYSVHIRLGLVVGFLLLILQVDLNPANNCAYRAIQALI